MKDTQHGIIEAIQLIENVYHAKYDPASSLSALEQLEICESIAETERNSNHSWNNENVNINRNANDTRKLPVNFELSKEKLGIILKLQNCNYKTSPFITASLLENFFTENPSNEGHWLYVAQNWSPRAINRVLQRMIKGQSFGMLSIQNPAKLFTYLIKFRAKRKNPFLPQKQFKTAQSCKDGS